MKSSSHLTVLALLHLFIEGYMSTSCGTFGNYLNATNPPAIVSSNYYLQDSTYFGIGAPLACAGNATRWNVCYYPTANSTSASATFAVYRCTSGSCNRYAQVAGSVITVTFPSYTSTPPSYVCTNISLTSPFTVNTGDVLVGCIPQNNGLHIAAFISGSSVYYSSTIGCSSQIDLSNNQGFNLQSGLTLLISLDVNECAVNNGGCGQICNDTTSGYNCSCYPGYQLQPDRLTCTMITTPVQSVVSSSSINIASTSSFINIASTSSSINIASISSSMITMVQDTTSISHGTISSFTTVQGSTTSSNMAYPQEGSAPAIAASITIIVIIAVVVIIATVLSVVLWQRRHARKLKISAARKYTIDNVMYSTTTGSVTTASDKAGTTAVHEPLKDEESKYAQAQATYESPQAYGVQNINNKQMIVQNHDSKTEGAIGDHVTLQVNEAYPRREKMMITQQNEAYGVHSRDQSTIAITPNEAYGVHSHDQLTIATSPNEAYCIHTGGVSITLTDEIYDVCKN